MEGTRGAAPEVLLYNPLPEALAHYTVALRQNLAAAGIRADTVCIDLELAGASRIGKFLQLGRALVPFVRAARTRQVVVVLWPIFGLLECVLWRLASPRKTRRLIVVHDPIPLRRQFGFSRLAAYGATWASADARIEIIAHTNLASRALEDRGVRVRHVAPHPILDVKTPARSPSRLLLVAGQYKESRDTSILEDIGQGAHDPWELRIVGRGWPTVPGWEVESKFLSEQELDTLLASASAVLVPYKHYFQSGIATRCLELGVPVVAERHEYLESLFGAQWPGFVDGEDARAWLEAAARAAQSEVSSSQTVEEIGLKWKLITGPEREDAR